MAHLQVVLLLVAAAFCASLAQFGLHPNGPNGGGPSPYGGPNNQGGYDQQILTCIGHNEAHDMLKITLTPERRRDDQFSHPAFAFGRRRSGPRELKRMDWRIDGVYAPASTYGRVSPAGAVSLTGRYHIVITRSGRTEGNCASLGGALQKEDLTRTPSGPGGGFGSSPYLGSGPLGSRFGALGHFGAGKFGAFAGAGAYARANPFAGAGAFGSSLAGGHFGAGGHPFSPVGGLSSLLGQGNGGARYIQQRPPGVVENTVLLSEGVNSFSTVVRDLADVDIRGRGISFSLDAAGYRPTTTCCCIVKDFMPANEVVHPGAQHVGPYSGTAIANLQNGIPPIGGVSPVGGFGNPGDDLLDGAGGAFDF